MSGRGVLHPDLLQARYEEEIEVRRAERQRVYDNMSRVTGTITAQSVAGWDEVIINMIQADLNNHWAQYQTENRLLLDALSDAASQQLAREESFGVAREYGQARSLLDERFQRLQSLKSRTAPKPSEITLPKFDGTYTAWVAWRAQFVNKVIDTSLSADAKIDLLLGSLSGEARQCAGESERRDQIDFDRMWAKLEATYDNRYQIVTQHVNRVLDLPVMTSPSPKGLRFMIDTVEQELRSLQRFGYLTDGWDPLVAVLMLRRLDQNTLQMWEMDHDPTMPPAKGDVIKFSEKRILALRNLSAAQSAPGRAVGHSPKSTWAEEDAREYNSQHGRRQDRTRSRSARHATTSNPFSKRHDDQRSSGQNAKLPQKGEGETAKERREGTPDMS